MQHPHAIITVLFQMRTVFSSSASSPKSCKPTLVISGCDLLCQIMIYQLVPCRDMGVPVLIYILGLQTAGSFKAFLSRCSHCSGNLRLLDKSQWWEDGEGKILHISLHRGHFLKQPVAYVFCKCDSARMMVLKLYLNWEILENLPGVSEKIHKASQKFPERPLAHHCPFSVQP